MDETRLRTDLVRHELAKADHLVSQKCTNKDAPVEKRSCVHTRSFKVHTVMGKRFSLANRALIVDVADSLKQTVTKWNFAKNNPTLLRLAGPIAGVGTNLLVPPILEG